MLFVNFRLLGVKNGRRIGLKLNIVVDVVKETNETNETNQPHISESII